MWRGRNGRRTHTLEFVSKISAGTLITHCNPTIETLLENFLDPKRKDVECSRSVNMQLRFSPIQHPAWKCITFPQTCVSKHPLQLQLQLAVTKWDQGVHRAKEILAKHALATVKRVWGILLLLHIVLPVSTCATVAHRFLHFVVLNEIIITQGPSSIATERVHATS